MNYSLRQLIVPVLVSALPPMFAAASGPPPVTVDQPVNVVVTNPEAAPVQVQDVDNPAFQPFTRSLLILFAPESPGGDASFTVPSGKRLVIEFVSFFSTLPVGQKPMANLITIQGIQFFFPSALQGSGLLDGLNRDVFTGVSPTRLYANPGTTVTVGVRRDPATGGGSSTVGISGYYVNVP